MRVPPLIKAKILGVETWQEGRYTHYPASMDLLDIDLHFPPHHHYECLCNCYGLERSIHQILLTGLKCVSYLYACARGGVGAPGRRYMFVWSGDVTVSTVKATPKLCERQTLFSVSRPKSLSLLNYVSLSLSLSLSLSKCCHLS